MATVILSFKYIVKHHEFHDGHLTNLNVIPSYEDFSPT